MITIMTQTASVPSVDLQPAVGGNCLYEEGQHGTFVKVTFRTPSFIAASMVWARCATRLVAKPNPTYIRSPSETAAPTSRLRADRAQEDETILHERPIFGPSKCSVRPTWIRQDRSDPGRLQNSVRVTHQAVFMTAPSITTPALTYFHSATSSLRASATIVDFLRRPPFCLTRSLNHKVSAAFG